MTSSFNEKTVGVLSSSAETNEPKVLCVGLSCLDIVHVCQHFPTEDSDERCQEYRWQRGGNACNNCTVLSLLGTYSEFLGTLGSSHAFWDFLTDDMRKFGIDFSHCPIFSNMECPMSTVIVTLDSGSRTILHHNPKMPELKVEDMEKLDLKNYSWIHFEGRNISRVVSMMRHVEKYNNDMAKTQAQSSKNYDDSNIKSPPMAITISVELEKKNSELLDLLPYADVAFISKDFAKYRGYDNMEDTLSNIARDMKSGVFVRSKSGCTSEPVIICAWGDRGAMARMPDGSIIQSPAFPPPKVIDTLGAGDAFTAATLHYLNRKKLSRQRREQRKCEITRAIVGERTTPFEETSFLINDTKNLEITYKSGIKNREFVRTEFIDWKVV